jgi:DNA-binding FadR family transcriptional regulator
LNVQTKRSAIGGKAERGKSRLHEAIAHRLGMEIVSGRIKPGEVLANEIESSEQLEVSRSAYREAVKMLAAKGLVESRPKTGTTVSARSRWNLLDPDVLAWIIEAGPSEEFLRGLFELRMIVEPAAAALAAERRTPAQLAQMRQALQAMERHTLSTEEGRAADREFHDIILQATGNDLLISLSSSIGTAIRWTTVFKQRKRELPRDPLPDHWRVFDAIAAGGPAEARRTTEELVRLALEDTRGSLDS